MKRILVLLIFCLPLLCLAQDTMYVAVKAGLIIRSGISSASRVITTVPYGEAIIYDTTQGTERDTVKLYNGFTTLRIPVISKGLRGYTIEAYLSSIPPPADSANGLKVYADQLSTPACSTTTNRDSNYEEQIMMSDVTILYQNGIIYIHHQGYESLSETLIIPGVGIQQAYIIAQNLTDIATVMPTDGKFPVQNAIYDSEGYEKTTKLYYSDTSEKDISTLEKLACSTSGDSGQGVTQYETLGISKLDNGHVVITYHWSL